MSMPTTTQVLNLALQTADGSDLPRPFCDDEFHYTHYTVHSQDFCPHCLSDWWATDGSEPYDRAHYWLQIIARRKLS